MRCPQCQRESGPSALYCPGCDHPLFATLVGALRCARCERRGSDQPLRCPHCNAGHPAGALEEINHLEYVARRLRAWRASGVLADDAAGAALREVEADLRAARATLPPIPGVRPMASQPAPAAPQRAPVTVARLAAVTPNAPPARPAPAPARPVRSAFTWRQVGAYLVSERTLNGLLALGALLILASAGVISTVNPTGLAPMPHLAVVIATTAAFFGAGLFVRRRLRLPRPGVALLAIGAAFVPLDVWALGQDELLDWPWTTTWLAASLVCLPIYLAAQLALRDRAFAALSAAAGGSLLLAAAYRLDMPLAWGLCALLALVLAYLAFAPRAPNAALRWGFFWSAQMAAPVVMLGPLAAAQLPALWAAATLPAPFALCRPGALCFDASLALAWWLDAAVYGLSSLQTRDRLSLAAATWTASVALLFTLNAASLPLAWDNLPLALLGLAYIVAAARIVRPTGPVPPQGPQDAPASGARPVLSSLIPHHSLLILVAILWPWQTLASAAPTLWVAAGAALWAAWRWGFPVVRYAAAYLAAAAFAATLWRLDEMGLPHATRAWHGLGYAALALGYLACARFARRAAEMSQPLAHPTRRPELQVAFLLTLVAWWWPVRMGASAVATPLALALDYGAAALLLRQRGWAYVGGLLLLQAQGTLLDEARVPADWRPLAWTGLAAVLLGAAEWAARRGGEARRPLREVALGLGRWRSPLAAPLFLTGYLAGAVAVALALGLYGEAPASAVVRRLAPPALAGFLALVALCAASAWARRSGTFLYLGTWLLVIPVVSGAGLVANPLGLRLAESGVAWLLLALGLAPLPCGLRAGLPGRAGLRSGSSGQCGGGGPGAGRVGLAGPPWPARFAGVAARAAVV